MWWGVSVALLAACSGGGDSADPTVAPTIRAETTTTTSAVAGQSSATTTLPVTTVPATTLPATTTPPTTPWTTAPDPTEQVIADFLAAWNAFNEAKLDPTSDEKRDAARSLLTGATLDVFDERIALFRANNWRSMTDPEHPARASVVDGSVEITGATASLTYCGLDSNILVEVGGLPDGGDAVINEAINAVLTEAELEWSGTVWLLARTPLVQEFPGALSCDG